MVVAIVAGEEGSGKTSQLLDLAQKYPQTMWGIMELKDKEKVMGLETDTFIPEVLFEEYPDGHEKQGNIDPLKTVRHVEQWRNEVYTRNPATIILDGISDLRAEVINAWVFEDNLDRVSKGRSPRKAIGEKNLGAWGEVNTRVREIMDPLINKGLNKHRNVIFTAQMKDKYRDGEIVGIEPALKSYMSYPIPCLFVFSIQGEVYNIACTKEPENPRWHIDSVAKHTGFLEALEVHGLIASPTLKNNYMMTYELDGEKKRTFVKAETAVEAENKFTRGYPGCTLLEVTE
jgi:hypothetical protein